MKKQYSTPTYAVVEFKEGDVIATSVNGLSTNVGFYYGGGWNGYARSVERPIDEWYEGE